MYCRTMENIVIIRNIGAKLVKLGIVLSKELGSETGTLKTRIRTLKTGTP